MCDGALGMARSHVPFRAWNQAGGKNWVAVVDMVGQNVPLPDLSRLLSLFAEMPEGREWMPPLRPGAQEAPLSK